MRGLTFGGKEIIDYSTVRDPELLYPSDAIVKITMSAICGSDLHVYHGRETGLDHGTVMGHEFTGFVEEAGRDVKKFKKGARVLSPFTTSCGECFYCRIGLTCRCEKGSSGHPPRLAAGFHWLRLVYLLHRPRPRGLCLPAAELQQRQSSSLPGGVCPAWVFDWRGAMDARNPRAADH